MLRSTIGSIDFKRVLFRPLSAVAAKATANAVGTAYHDMLHRGRKNNRINVTKDLKRIMKLCGPKQARYAGTAVDWFQEKRYDFTEELNSIFINICIEDDQVDIATSRLLYKKGRIGAWTSTSSLNRLLAALLEKGDAETMAQLLFTLTPKGVRINATSIGSCLDACCRSQQRELYQRVVSEVAVSHISETELVALTEKYPIPAEAGKE